MPSCGSLAVCRLFVDVVIWIPTRTSAERLSHLMSKNSKVVASLFLRGKHNLRPNRVTVES